MKKANNFRFLRHSGHLFLICLVFSIVLIGSMVWAQTPPVKWEFVDIPLSKDLMLPGLLYSPQGISSRVAVINVHAMRESLSVGAPRFFGLPVAEAGYTVLSFNERRSGFGDVSGTLEDSEQDIGAAVNFMKSRGFLKIILTGHSLGNVEIVHYTAKAQDPSIVALITFAPTMPVNDFAKRAYGEKLYEATTKMAKEKVAAGQSDYVMVVRYEFPPPAPKGTMGTHVRTAAAWLSWYAPDSKAVLLNYVDGLKIPMLNLAGTRDVYVPPVYLDQIKAAAKNSPRVDSILFPDEVHYFQVNTSLVVSSALKWLKDVVPPDR
jgi:pimeloyl-ACP methyl ester carboxylesterase